mgnify:CR=1 FL=1
MGDITHIATSDGTVVVHYIYDAYGQITDTEITAGYSAIANANPYRYRGYLFDSEISMYYLNSRYYNPEVGRFINADGIFGEVGNLKSTNMYMYSNNNPIMYVDTTGEWAIFAALASIGPVGWIAIAIVVVIAVAYVSTDLLDPVVDTLDNVTTDIINGASDIVQTVKENIEVAAIDAAFTIAATMGKNQETRYWSASLGGGIINIGRSLTYQEAVTELAAGRNVICRFSWEARAAATEAGAGVEPLFHLAHRTGFGYYDHYHVGNHIGKAHCWYIYF